MPDLDTTMKPVQQFTKLLLQFRVGQKMISQCGKLPTLFDDIAG